MTTAAKSTASSSQAFWENVRTIVYALALAMSIRFAIAQPFRIPSGSMQPTLMVGDYIVVTKWSYGYSRFSFAPFEGVLPGGGRLFGSEPERGDIVVFRPPTQPDKDFVKRLIGMPGETIEVVDGQLFIDNEPVQREFERTTWWSEAGRRYDVPTYRETLPNGVSYTTFDKLPGMGDLDNWGPVVIPEGHYFMMGDDRDNSQDSRTLEVGPIPYDHLVGKAQFVALSFDETTRIWKPWTMFTGFRGERFLKGLGE